MTFPLRSLPERMEAFLTCELRSIPSLDQEGWLSDFGYRFPGRCLTCSQYPGQPGSGAPCHSLLQPTFGDLPLSSLFSNLEFEQMRISGIVLKKFKRFTDLTISEIPDTARIVVIVGPNGCGKSSIFDALNAEAVVQYIWGWSSDFTMEYWPKIFDGKPSTDWRKVGAEKEIDILFHEGTPRTPESWKKSIYIRTAYRNDPSIKVQRLNPVGPIDNEPRIPRIIDNDATVVNNYQRLVSDSMEKAFEKKDGSITLNDFREEIIGEIRDPIKNLFSDPPLILNSLGNPLNKGTFRFTKGASKGYSYENLSGGEKAAFDLVLDLVIKRREYNDTVFCIDEPEAHLGTRIQRNLLDELYNLIPEKCQLWIATHSIGMMRSAFQLNQKRPGTVAFLNFYEHDFDSKVEIRPRL